MRIDLASARREGEWLALVRPAGSDDWPEAGSHPHEVRKRLLASSLFPAKWINRLFSVGGIRMEGERVLLHAFPAAHLDRSELYRMAALPPANPKLEALAVPLWEDDYALVLNKPAGMRVHGASPGERGTLAEAAARHCLLAGDPQPVRHIHRLDDDTSGPVLFAKNDLAQWRLDEAMRGKEVDRRYVAIVQGRLKASRGTIDLPIGRDRHHRSRRCVTRNGDAAVTHYEVAEQFRSAALVRIRLETGRTHQIRVHFSHIGHPLLGDGLYGGDVSQLAHQALHGERLLFRHPLTGEPVEVRAVRPAWLDRLIGKLRDS